MYSEYLSRKIRRRKILITATAAVLTSLTFLIIALYSTTNYYPANSTNSEPREDASCHYVTEGDALPKIDERFFPSSNSIFFHETSCQGRLDSRQACSIESAARTHPDWEIHVLFSSPVNKLTLGDVNMELLRLMKNVYFSRVHIVDYAKGTSLEELVISGALNKTHSPISDTSDLLRYLTLYKWGGIYLSLKTLVVKPLEELGGNWAIRENKDFIGSTAMSFYRDSAGTFVADAVVRRIAKTFRGDTWNLQRQEIMTDVLKDICSTGNVTEMAADKCLGFEVYPPEFMKSLKRVSFQKSFREGNLEPNNGTYLYYMRSRLPHGPVSWDALYAKLAKRYCPIVYETYGNKFGI